LGLTSPQTIPFQPNEGSSKRVEPDKRNAGPFLHVVASPIFLVVDLTSPSVAIKLQVRPIHEHALIALADGQMYNLKQLV